MNRIVSFRGLIVSGGIDTIPLHTINGALGYKIVKFELMPQTPMTVESENVVKIYTIPQTAVTATIDFSDNTLIASGFTEGQPAAAYNTQTTLIFDNITFNQDIHVTHSSEQNIPINYYLELEQMPLDLNENTVATLKDIRNIARTV